MECFWTSTYLQELSNLLLFESFLNWENEDLVYVRIMLLLLYSTHMVLLLRSIKFQNIQLPTWTSTLKCHNVRLLTWKPM